MKEPSASGLRGRYTILFDISFQTKNNVLLNVSAQSLCSDPINHTDDLMEEIIFAKIMYSYRVPNSVHLKFITNDLGLSATHTKVEVGLLR